MIVSTRTKGRGVVLSKRGGRIAFVLLMAIMSLTYGYQDILLRRPQGIHQWRQADCLSITLNYSKPDARVLDSRIHYLGRLGNGKTISEFPLFYYAIGKLWRHTGQSEPIFRAIVLALFYGGMFALFITIAGILKDNMAALFVVGLLFTSPMLAYYANNFLMNAPALSLVFIGWYCIWAYSRYKRKGILFLGVFFFLIAGTLKASAALSLLVLLCLVLISNTRVKQRFLGSFVLPHHGSVLGTFIISLAALFGWYSYAHAYNTANANAIFLVGVLPIWDLDSSAIHSVLSGVKVHFLRDYFRPFLYPVFVALTIPIILFWRNVPRVVLTSMGLLLLGSIAIALLFFQALREHDYYSLDQLIIVPFLLVCSFIALDRRFPGVSRTWWVQVVMIALLIHCTDFARRRMIDRYSGWMNAEYIDHTRDFGSIEPYLEQLNITKEDRVVCLPDPSPNITLYLMDRKGWTDFDSLSYYPERMQNPIRLGAKYLLVYKKSVYSRPGLYRYLANPIGHYKNIDIYRLPPS